MALSAPNSPVDICNLALSYLAEDFVSNIDTPPAGDDTAALCKLHYPKVRRALLRSHPWNFAIKRAALAADAAAPTFGFTTKYQLPGDFIRYLSKHDALGNRTLIEPIEGVDYQLEDGYILTGDTADGALRIRYIYDHELVSAWDDLFIDLISVKLALSLARNFKSAPRSIDDLNSRLRELQAEAKAIDGQERPPIRVQRSKFLAARRNRSSTVASKYTKFD